MENPAEEPVKRRRRPKVKKVWKIFPGFRRSPATNYTKIPNEWFDICAKEIENLAELKIVLYIIRRTWGYSDYEGSKHITVDDFIFGTGLPESSVKFGISQALEHGFIEVEVNDKDKGRIRKVYKMKMLAEEASEGQDLTRQSLTLQNLDLQALSSEGQKLPSESQKLTAKGAEKGQNLTLVHVKEKENSLKENEGKKDSPRSSFFSEEENRIDAYYHTLTKRQAPLNEDVKKYWTRIAQDIDNLEEMVNLYEFSKARITGNDPKVYPGNLYRDLDDWLKEKASRERINQLIHQPSEEVVELEELEAPEGFYASRHRERVARMQMERDFSIIDALKVVNGD